MAGPSVCRCACGTSAPASGRRRRWPGRAVGRRRGRALLSRWLPSELRLRLWRTEVRPGARRVRLCDVAGPPARVSDGLRCAPPEPSATHSGSGTCGSAGTSMIGLSSVFVVDVVAVFGVDAAGGDPARDSAPAASRCSRGPLRSVSMAGRCDRSASNRISRLARSAANSARRPATSSARLGPQSGRQLAAQLRLHRQLVFPPRRDLAVQLQVVDQLQVARLGLIDVALPAVDEPTRTRPPPRPTARG